MQKNGFTLTEMLITISIIGIVAAIAVPSVTRVVPDKYKPKVLKTYQTISKTTSELLADEGLYYRKDPSTATQSDINTDGTLKTSTQYGCIGLNCTETPLSYTGYNDSTKYSGICKYPNLMATMLSSDTPTLCTASTLYSSFKTSDGTLIDIKSITGTSAEDGYNVEIDIDQSSNGKNCVYNKTSCKNPDQFKFIVDGDGNVKADSTDYLTEVYLEHMTRIDRKADFVEAYNK